MTTAQIGKTVKVHYTGKLENGEVFDSSKGREPLEFTMGKGQMIPGFEKGVDGMSIGDTKEIKVSPAEGYGERREDLVAEYEKSMFPDDLEIHEGMQLQSRTEDGHVIPLVVKKIEGSKVTLDANHFLAGQNLIFEVELVAVS
ncbi:MAG: peptidylprolyl isomerase [Desulforegulaceae bacterium]|nr:peptidylprolyl isomerase [Desulforegulaceae bacterium]